MSMVGLNRLRNVLVQGREFTNVRWSPLFDFDVSRLNKLRKYQMLPPASHANRCC
jgi:hypothetical protein